jgi:hypothetical protein
MTFCTSEIRRNFSFQVPPEVQIDSTLYINETFSILYIETYLITGHDARNTVMHELKIYLLSEYLMLSETLAILKSRMIIV